jgi:hypothetical protein
VARFARVFDRNADDADLADLHGFLSLTLHVLAALAFFLQGAEGVKELRGVSQAHFPRCTRVLDRNADDTDLADLHGFYALVR